MAPWTRDELTKIGTAEELRIAFLRRDGALGNPRIVWVVRHGDDLYVRSVQGRTSAWFHGTRVRHEGRIWAGGVEQDVTFVDVGDDVNDQVDARIAPSTVVMPEHHQQHRKPCGAVCDDQTRAALNTPVAQRAPGAA